MDSILTGASIPDSDYIIIGGTGDLALRKIFPALFWRYLDKQITSEFRLISVSRHLISLESFSKKLRPFCEDAFSRGKASEDDWKDFFSLIRLIEVDVISGSGGEVLAELVNRRVSSDRPCIYYLAIAPSLFGSTCNLLKKMDLVTQQSRLVVEKPLGQDGLSAKEINDGILRVFEENQIYRIDHYLGKETVQNLMALRFANVIFESLWNNNHIDNVQITVAESIGVGDRVTYYDAYGATRDMVQNHLLQLVCLVAMEPPAHFNANQVRDEKLRVLRALRPMKKGHVVRGQYDNYLEELNKASNTETYVAMKLGIDNWRWAGVPFYIRTGKKLTQRASEIIITFKDRLHDIFTKSGDIPSPTQPNRLVIRLQPSEGLRLQLVSKQPGPGGMRLFPSELNLNFDEAFNERLPDAYERLLMDTARGNQTLFMRLDEVLAAWDFIDPIVAMTSNQEPLTYQEGSMGPKDNLFGSSGRCWIDPRMDEL